MLSSETWTRSLIKLELNLSSADSVASICMKCNQTFSSYHRRRRLSAPNRPVNLPLSIQKLIRAVLMHFIINILKKETCWYDEFTELSHSWAWSFWYKFQGSGAMCRIMKKFSSNILISVTMATNTACWAFFPSWMKNGHLMMME